MIKVVTFDLDGVYFLNGKSNFIANLAKLGVSEEEAKRVFLKSDQMNLLYKCGKITGNDFWQWAAQEWKLQKTPLKLVDLLISGYEINKQADELVKSLRRKGIKTAICSNNFKERIEGLDKRFNFLKDFNVVVLSYEVGFTKPDKRIFAELIRKSAVKAEEILYSDDGPEAVAAAKLSGINAFLYEKFADFQENLVKFKITE